MQYLYTTIVAIVACIFFTPSTYAQPCAGTSSITVQINNCTTATEQNLEEYANLRLFPNPTAGNFQLSWFNLIASDIDIYLYNSLGQLLHHTRLVDTPIGETQLPMQSNYPKGMYWLSIRSKMGEIGKKLIIQ